MSATAFARSAGPTIWKTSACRAGPPTACDDALQQREQVDLPDRDDVGERRAPRAIAASTSDAVSRHERDRAAPRSGRASVPTKRPSTVTGSSCVKRERADRDGRMRQLQHEPRGRDLLHPRPGERDRLAAEVEAVVPVLADARERLGASAVLTAARKPRSAGRRRTRCRPASVDRDRADDRRDAVERRGSIGSARASSCSGNQSRADRARPPATAAPGSSSPSKMPVLLDDHVVARVAPVEDHRVGSPIAPRRPRPRARPTCRSTFVEPAPRELVHRRRHAAAAAELGRDDDLPLVLRLDRQQPVPFDVDVEEVEVGVPRLHPLEHRLALRGVVDDVHVRAGDEPGACGRRECMSITTSAIGKSTRVK